MSSSRRWALLEIGAKTRRLPGRLRIGRGLFRFEAMTEARVSAMLDCLEYRASGRPPIRLVDDVLFDPELRCLYRSDGGLIPESKLTYTEPGAPPWFNPDKIEEIELDTMPAAIEPRGGLQRVSEPVLFLGELHDHYGHFVTDSLARAWALNEFGPSGKVLFAPDPGARLQAPHVRYSLEQLGIDESRILRPQAPVLLEQVYCPVPALQLSRVYGCYDEPHRRIAARALAAHRLGGDLDRPIYLSRRGLGPEQRRLRGEDNLEMKLSPQGFAVVRPEQLGFLDQIAMFNTRHPIVGPFGSALHTVLFRERGRAPRIGNLCWPKLPPRYLMVDAVKGARALYANCITSAALDEDDPDGGKIWMLNADAALAALDAAGFLPRPH